MRNKITILAALLVIPVAAQSVRFNITVVNNSQTNTAMLNITNAAFASKIIALATNKVPQANPAQAVKAVTKNRLQELVNDVVDQSIRERAATAAETAAQAVLNAAQSEKIDDSEK